MHIARKLILLAVMAAVTMAFVVPSALAAPVEVESAESGGHCSSDHCPFHAVDDGGITFNRHVPGTGEAVMATCQMEFSGNMTELGETTLTSLSISPGTSNCGVSILECRSPPITGADQPWHLLIEENIPANLHGILEMCVDFRVAPPIPYYCRAIGDGELEVNKNGDDTYMLTKHQPIPWAIESNVATPATAQPACNALLTGITMEGEWNTETPNIIIHHV